MRNALRHRGGLSRAPNVTEGSEQRSQMDDNAQEDESYEHEVQQARDADLSGVENRGIVTVVRESDGSLITDSDGNALVMVIPALIPRIGGSVWEHCFQLFIRETGDICDQTYRVIYVHSGFSPPLWLGWWLIRVRNRLSRAHRKNLQAVSIVHPTLTLRVICMLLSAFVSQNVWRKVHYVDRLEELWLDEVMAKEVAQRIIPGGVAMFEEALIEENEMMREAAVVMGVPVEPRQLGAVGDDDVR
ncbi:CRAL-TRIO lipid binding protein [Gracilaria domingensis]|nr:CRAL-TRIO lipid binding protein [Gracilaria domingensis]